MDFSFATANSIHFGAGSARALSRLLPRGTNRVFVATGSSPQRHQATLELLEKNGINLEVYPISNEPTVDSLAEAIQAARNFEPQIIIGIGGGSVIDAGKAIAALIHNTGDLMEYLEVVGKGRPLDYPSLPYMAVPTTAGTGSEVTRNSVIGVPNAGVKVSLRSPFMLPHWAVVDPELTFDLPAEIAAYTGIDALTQNLEAFLSKKANPLSDAIAREGIKRAAHSLKAACGETLDRNAKSDLCVASLCGGIALANANLGAVHGFAGPIGGMIDAPHGALCGSLLLHVCRANFDTATRRDPDGVVVRKFDEIALLLTDNPAAKGTYAIAWLDALIKDLPLKSLSQLEFTSDLTAEAADKASRASSMKGNPVELSQADLREILQDALT
ncbi:MAG: alcohol dehydrogenase class IV [Candidatus Pelagisphaera sp.]|jgi:alcohol dehydrogenase class IV